MVVGATSNDDVFATPEDHKEEHFPSSYENVLSVTNSNADDTITRASIGSWVDMAAPGMDVLSTYPLQTYTMLSGTSMATPFVSGAAAVLFSQNPTWKARDVRERLIKSAKPITSIYGGRLDLFEAVFNGSFDHKALYGWRKVSRDKVQGNQLIEFDNSSHIDGSDYTNHPDAKISQTFALKLHDEYDKINGGGCDTCFPYGTDINVDDPHDDSDKFLALTVSESSFEEQVNSSAHDGRTVKYISINQPFVIQEHVKKFKISFDYFLIGEYFAPMPMRNDRTVGASSTYRIYIKFKNNAGEELAYFFLMTPIMSWL